MKKQIRPYYKFAFKKNILYLVLIFLLASFSIALVLLAPGIFTDNNNKIKTLKADVKDFRLKKVVLDSLLLGNSTNIEDDVAVMGRLIPEVEDYFSIIASLDELSAKTNFIITSYSIDIKNSNSNKLSLNINGVGDEQSFINFLKQYNFQGGRLITIENISLGKEEAGAFSLILNFYNERINTAGGKNLDYQNALQKVNEIKSKVTFSLQPTSEKIPDEDYAKESNPFQ